MNINIFFTLVSSLLLVILFVFKPLKLDQKEHGIVPLFELSNFSMKELNTNGLITIMNGTKGTKFTNEYIVKDMDYTDNSKDFLANLKSNTGTYKDDIVNLVGNVVYFREDGLTFESEEATYNKKTSIATTRGKYIIYKDKDTVTGTQLVYNNLMDTVKSKNVNAIYQIKKSNK